MEEKIEMKVIARYHCAFKDKFGLPRQSGIVEELPGKIVFEPEYRNIEAFRGIEDYSHLWLIWLFSKADGWSNTVRPPKLGGNKRMGVFATRSPFRPNNIGLSCVRLERFEISRELGPILHVKAGDLLDGTPILDVKPYLSYTDSRPDAVCGFAKSGDADKMEVVFESECSDVIDEKEQKIIASLLEQDPRPGYQDDPERAYFMKYADFDIEFKVVEKRIIVYNIKKSYKNI